MESPKKRGENKRKIKQGPLLSKFDKIKKGSSQIQDVQRIPNKKN